MTDNKIIKALECCTDESYENCNECPYSIDTLSCERIKLLEDSLDLINRKQAEIERLNKVCQANQQLINALNKSYFLAKAKAYKEFAERLENEINIRTTYSREQDKNVIHIMHNLLKEMVDDTE